MVEKASEVLTINVRIISVQEVKGNEDTARMILFDGDVDCENFKGKILPGGVDTQKSHSDGTTDLSARYILEGTDRDGNECRIFIENNGTFTNLGEMRTCPRIITDSPVLSYLENAELYGTIEGIPGGVRIHIFG